MPDQCDPSSSVPKYCADAFSRIMQTQATHGATLDAIKDQTMRTNGHVNELFQKTDKHAERLATLEAGDKIEGRNRAAAWGLMLVLAGAGSAALFQHFWG